MGSDNGVANDDCLENRLKEATADDSRSLLEEFLRAFCVHRSEATVVDIRPSAIHYPELEE
jgi:hypothetical protein